MQRRNNPPPEPLRVAASLRIVRKHRNAPGITVGGARDEIQPAELYAGTPPETKALERRTT
jgi:hypothetical protein